MSNEVKVAIISAVSAVVVAVIGVTTTATNDPTVMSPMTIRNDVVVGSRTLTLTNALGQRVVWRREWPRIATHRRPKRHAALRRAKCRLALVSPWPTRRRPARH
jgi:hypothetical protein